MAGTPDFSRTYSRITTRLLQSVSTSQTVGRDELAGALLQRIADGIVAACEANVTAVALAERLAQTLVALAEEGLEYEATGAEGSWVLSRLECRWSRLAGDSPDASLQEARIFSRLLNAEVTPIHESNEETGSRLLVRPMHD
jgi:predicted ArsR family transcriptional regulator